MLSRPRRPPATERDPLIDADTDVPSNLCPNIARHRGVVAVGFEAVHDHAPGQGTGRSIGVDASG